ncbi:MAG: cyclic nucleotide-binding domain-containing protein [Caldilineaceae bacterium]
MDRNLIKFAPLFMGLSEQDQRTLTDNFTEGRLAAGEALFRAGEQSDALYLLGQGFARLTSQSGQSLATLGPGSVLGEASLFRNIPQDVTATAVADIEYWRLTDQKLRAIVLEHPSIGITLSNNFGDMLAQMEDYLVQRLSGAEELGDLPHNTLQALASKLQAVELVQNQPLYTAGDEPPGLFLIEKGAIELRPEPGSDERAQVVRSGALLGVLPLLTNKPSSHDAVALELSMLWGIPTDQFQTLSNQHRGLRRSLGRKVRARLGKADQAKAVARLAEMPIFAELTPDVLRAIAQRMTLQYTSAGERVYRMGESGDSLYLIENGEIELTAENASGVIEELARISSGGFFGEMSIFTGQTRTEDATATRHTNLWVLDKSELDALAAQRPEISAALSQGLAARLAAEQNEDEQRFRHFELFESLTNEELVQIVPYLHPTRFGAGEQIFRASGSSDSLYLIERGEVRVQTFNGGSWLLGPGESFGERALLTNQPHSASVSAETDVDLWALSKNDFNNLVNQHPGLAINLTRILGQRLAESNAYTPQSMSAAGGAFGSAQQMRSAQGAPYGSPYGAPAGEAQYQYYEDPNYQDGAPITAAQRRRAAAAQQMSRGGQRMGFGAWFRNLSGMAKLRLAVIILLLIWVLGIAAPSALMALIRGARTVSDAFLPTSSSGALAAVYSLGSWEVAAQDQESARAIALADRMAPPTATYTPLPTQTPPATSTPLATNTPLPTNTPSAPAFVQGYINVGQQAEVAAAAAAPAEQQVQAAALAPRAWDPRLDRLGVRVEEANVPSGQPYWRLIEAMWWDEKEAGGKHHIYVEVLDENGSRVVGQPVTVKWGDGQYDGATEDKAYPDYGFNYQMYAAGNAYDVIVNGLPSDKLVGAGMGDLDRPRYGIHTAFRLIYQRTIKP